MRLVGGTNLYRYVPNPIQWVDPLGLTAEKEDPFRQFDALVKAQQDNPGMNDAAKKLLGESLLDRSLINQYKKTFTNNVSNCG